ncbi:phosphate acetyltransferase [Alteribacillus bidgolensis]|uniref:Phosphate acetyltransferase n=1 Tax=Alteribacillus bidgolensis TaxID=930129 RepID=A0A1G8H5R6_9BACI|nr:phosphate acetyltransferase [Alteribacillus bidgolensis]SDI02017.1 phosphotransacetylase [Alteribacillus bidgolensis]
MNILFSEIIENVRNAYPTIVFPEGEDERVLQAAYQLDIEKLIRPVLIGREKELIKKWKDLFSSIPETVKVCDPQTCPQLNTYRDAMYDKRKSKMTKAEAENLIQEPNYFGMMLLERGEVNGFVGGAQYATRDILKPAMQLIKTKPSVKRISSYFVMLKEKTVYFFADCAVNVSPQSRDLAEIANLTACSTEMFNINPRVAFLSYSTNGSAQSEETAVVHEAVRIFKQNYPKWPVDGEIQFDAAIIPEIAQKKSPYSPLQGNANVFVFPNLDAANIAYKITQRLGGFQALGPILQGLNKPVNDLSRGCSSTDIYYMALITGLQCIEQHQAELGKSVQ